METLVLDCAIRVLQTLLVDFAVFEIVYRDEVLDARLNRSSYI
jgi:hypothetical protein